MRNENRPRRSGPPPSDEPQRSARRNRRFSDRGGPGWVGPIIDYKEVELLRKFLTSSSKLMSRRRAGTNAQEQKDLRAAVKRARFMALIPYVGT